MVDLDALIAQGRDRQAHEQRLAAAAARQAEVAAQTVRSANDRAALALRTNTVLSSISSLHSWSWIGLMFAPIPLAVAPTMGAALLVPTAALLLQSLGFWLWVRHRRRELLRITAALPFPVADLGLGLDWGRSYPSCRLTVDFVGPAPPLQRIEQAFAALRGARPLQSVKVDKREGERRIVLLVDSEEGSKFDGHRRWLVRWWLEAARVVLPTLHRAHPIERLTFPS